MTTRVVNIHNTREVDWGNVDWKASPGYVYIGRANRRAGLKGSPWANPFPIARDLVREDSLRMFTAWVTLSAEPAAVWIREHVHELRGKTLVCWCAPLPCHGDVLAAMADAS